MPARELTSTAPLPQLTHSPPKRGLRACPAKQVTSGFNDAFRTAVSTKGGALNGNWLLHVALLASAACRAARHSAVVLPGGLRLCLSASSHAEYMRGSAADALGLSGLGCWYDKQNVQQWCQQQLLCRFLTVSGSREALAHSGSSRRRVDMASSTT